MNCEGLEFRLLCSPDTSAIEAQMNKIIKKNKGKKIERTHLATAPYIKKIVRTKCPKCNKDLFYNPNNLNAGATCKACNLAYSQQEVEANTTIEYQQGGSFFLLAVWMRDEK